MKALGNLPGQLTSFVGREATVALVGRRLQADRLVSLVGPGGCGKTRLAIETGRRFADLRSDGVFFVDLSALSDPGLVPGAVLRAVGLRAAPGRGRVGALVSQLSERDVLLLLDNCEHLVDACASLADALVRGCPRLWALATSREPLAVIGEVIVPVGGLELPDRDQRCREEWLENSEAGRLFIDRATRRRPDFVIDDPEAVAEICERLDGIPLAIELAAARARHLSAHAIAEGLSDRFRLLVGGGRAGPHRQKSLLASIEWSYSLLTEEERTLLRRLSVFASGFTIAAGEAVCAGGQIGHGDVLGLLTSLVDKSLVQADAGADRFRLHETMRAYAGAALEGEVGTATLRDCHLAYFTSLAPDVGLSTSESIAALAALEPDLDNLRAALDWSVESEQFDAGADLLGALGLLFWVLGLWAEGWARCGRFLAAELGPLRRAEFLNFAALYVWNCDPMASLRLASELIALGRSLGADWAVAQGLFIVANVQAWAQPDDALRTADEEIEFARKVGQQHHVGVGLHNKAWAYFWLGQPEEALSLAEESLGACRDADDVWGLLSARTISSIAATCSGHLSRGLEEAEALLQLSAEVSAPTFACWGERHCAEAYMYLGDAGAPGAFARARALAESIDDTFNLGLRRCGSRPPPGLPRTGRRRLRDPGGGQFNVGGARVGPHVREQPGCVGRAGPAARRLAQRPVLPRRLHLAVAEKARSRGGAHPAGGGPAGPGRKVVSTRPRFGL